MNRLKKYKKSVITGLIVVFVIAGLLDWINKGLMYQIVTSIL